MPFTPVPKPFWRMLSASLALVAGLGALLWSWNSAAPLVARKGVAPVKIAAAEKATASSSGPVATPVAVTTAPAKQATVFGVSGPVKLEEVPAGRFKDQLLKLAPEARERALKKLGDLHVPFNDVNSLSVDRDGFLFYACDPSAAQASQPLGASDGGAVTTTNSAVGTAVAASVSTASPPVRHSKAGAANVIYLDFNGHTVTGTAWNDPVASYVCVPYDFDGDPTTFSDAEQTAIIQIWERIAEDYAPFDVDVTTEVPANFTARTARVLITRSVDANGLDLPQPTMGGVAYIDVFGTASFASRSPAFVYFNNLYGPENVAEAASHEVGHNLGLSHDGTATEEYYRGHGNYNSNLSWAPIMGAAYGKNVTQWSKGEYYGANNFQDDLAIIAAKLGGKTDDHSALLDATATSVTVTGDTFSGQGVIGLGVDADVFKISTNGGTLAVTAAPFRSQSGPAGNNLDIALTLFDSAGTQVAEANPASSTSASLTVPLARGNYFLKVTGVGTGNPLRSPIAGQPTGYTSYGSLGQYTLSAAVPLYGPPVILSGTTASVGVGHSFSYALVAAGTPTSFFATGLPVGLSLDSTTGVISGRPTQLGTTAITIGATNELGTATTVLTLSVIDSAPAVMAQTSGLKVLQPGGGVTLTATGFSLNGTIAFQWMHDGVAIAGATTATLNLANISAAAEGAYWLELTNAIGKTRSQAVIVRVRPAVTQVRAWGYDLGGALNVPAALGDAVAIAAGNFFALALRADGSVVGWGDSNLGAMPSGLVAMAIAAGDYHSLVLKPDGTVVAWGNNNYGQATVPAGLTNVVAIAAGGNSSFAIKSDGTVVAWGFNANRIPSPLADVRALAAGGAQGLALRRDGSVVFWDDRGTGQSALPVGLSEIVAISAGSSHALALGANGSIFAWGNNASGQATVPIAARNAIAIAGAGDASLALKSNGTVVAWGSTGNTVTAVPTDLGQVIAISGSGTSGLALRDATGDVGPTIMVSPTGGLSAVGDARTFSVSAGGPGVLAYQWRKDGTPISGATNSSLTLPSIQLADAGSYTVVVRNHFGSVTSAGAVLSVESPPAVTSAPAARRIGTPGQPLTLTVAATSANGPLRFQWKKNNRPINRATAAVFSIANFSNADAGAYTLEITDAHGLVTRATTFVQPNFGLTQLRGWGFNAYNGTGPLDFPAHLDDAIAAATSGYFSLALKSDGTVAAWGSNVEGQTSVPAGLTNVVAIAASYYHALALKADGTVVAWGSNSGGQTTVPASLSGVIAIAAGDYFSLALKSDGTIVAWGAGSSGQTAIPVGLDNVIAITASGAHSLALQLDGTVIAWGADTAGQYAVPAGLAGVTAIAAGSNNHSMAVKADGTVAAWGPSYYSQNTVPTGLSGVVAAAEGGDFSIALKSDGSVVAWGSNNYGQRAVPINLTQVLALSAGSSTALVLRSAATDSAPTVTTQPVGALAQSGTNYTFTAAAGGAGPFAFQWRKGGVPISGATSPTLALTNLQVTDTGSYDVVVSNHIGGTTSASAVLTVEAPPTISASTAARLVGTVGQPLNLAVTATSANTPLTYQWKKNNRPISGATAASLSIPSFANTDAGAYTLVITDAHGLITRTTTFVLPTYGLTQVRGWGSNSSGERNIPLSLNNVIALAGGTNFSVALKSDGTVTAWGGSASSLTAVPASLANVVAVSAGESHTLALKSDGTVVAWGSGGSGQTAVPAGLSGVIAVSAGASYSLALKSDGTVVGWGENYYGQSAPPAGLTDVTAIAAGGIHALALKSDGTVVAWGYNGSGQTAVPVGLSGVVALAAGNSHSLALRNDGTTVGWGYNAYTQTEIPSSSQGAAAAISAGTYFSAAIKKDGSVIVWGDGSSGQKSVPADLGPVLALDAGTYHLLALRVASSDSAPTIALQPINVTAQAGGNAVFSVAASGVGPFAYQWRKSGVNISGATAASLALTNLSLADAGSYDVVVSNHVGSVTSNAAALAVEAPPTVTSVPAPRITGTPGQALTLSVAATSANGPLTFQWKKNNRPISGATTATLTLPNFTNADAGAYTLVITDARGFVTRTTTFVLPGYTATQVRGWGSNSYGQLTVPAGLATAIAVESGSNFSLTLKADGTVAAWGYNGSGQTAVPAGLASMVAVAAGGSHALALKADGTVIAWGNNSSGQTTVPAGLSEVIAIRAGGSHSLALKSDGTVVAWGSGSYLQSTVPAGLSDVTAITAGSAISAALKVDGTVTAWGYLNANSTPVPSSVVDIKALAAGGSFFLAAKNDGTVLAWGQNYYGETTVPSGLAGVAAVAAGGYNSVALKADGTVVAWGSNDNGQNAVPADLGSVLQVGVGSGFTLALRDTSADAVPAITAQPAGGAAAVAGNFTFTVTASGPGPLFYQWRKDGAAISNAKSATLALTNLATTAAGSYDVVVSNHIGSVTSNAAVLTVEAPPAVVTAPTARVVGTLGQTISLSVAATSANAPLSYQWSKNNRLIAGATTATFALPSFANTDAGAYTVAITDAHGLVTRSTTFVLPSYGLTQVRGWGQSTNGETAVPADLNDALAVAAGSSYSLALRSGGTVAAWGYGGSGLTTVPVGLADAIAVAAGGSSALALKADGTVVAWGSGFYQSSVPTGLAGVIAISATGSHALALKADGTVVAWGNNAYGQTTVPTALSGVVAISAGGNHSLALKSDGTVVAWGYNSSGQTAVPAGLSGIVTVAAGADHSVALGANGSAVVWGYNYANLMSVPAGARNFTAISAGGGANVALKADGSALAWGTNTNSPGILPVPVDLGPVLAISLGSAHGLALRTAVAEAPPVITAQPIGGVAAIGGKFVFSVTATGAGQLTYQWRKAGTIFAGATRAAFALDGIESADAGSYDVIVSNHIGSVTSAVAVLTVESPPTITAAPAARIIGPLGQPLALTVAATSANGPLSFQWKKNNRPIAGANTATFSLANFTNTDAGAYTLEITDAHGLVTRATTFVLPNLGVTQVRGWGPNSAGENDAPAAVRNAIGVATGSQFSVALLADGTVAAWGSNYYYNQTQVPAGLASVVAVATGEYHTLALRADGTAVGWGNNYSGQATPPPGLSGVIAIAAAGSHSLALKSDGTAVEWGVINSGSSATKLPAGLSGVVAIAAGSAHALALKADGTVVAWGDNGSGQTSIPAGLANVVAIAAGAYHSLALKSDGSVVAWGQSYAGQTSVPANLANVVALSGGQNTSTALKADGSVAMWGNYSSAAATVPADLGRVVALSASYHALAIRDASADAAPVITAPPAGARAQTGGSYTFSVVASGVGPLTYQWRKDGIALTGATATALTLANLTTANTGSYDVIVSNHIGGVTSAAATLTVEAPPVVTTAPAARIIGTIGQQVSLSATATSANGPLTYQWKKNNRPIAGATAANFSIPNFTNTDAGAYTLEIADAHGLVTRTTTFVLPRFGATQVRSWGTNSYGQTVVPVGLNDAIAVSGGGYFSLALKADGTVAVWGGNSSGQTPVPAGLSNVVQVAAGSEHALALKADGTVVAWGQNYWGQTTVPAGLSGVIAIRAGYSHSLALKSDGTVVAWGQIQYGQPIPQIGLTNVVAISAGNAHDLAVLTDGTVFAWGDGSSGRTAVPAGLSDAVTVAAGGGFSLVLKANGTVMPWGQIYYSAATVPAGLAGVTDIAAGYEFALARKADGTLVAWGQNGSGQTAVPADLGTILAFSAGNAHALVLRDASADSAPAITVQPADATVIAGGNYSTFVAHTGTGPFSYQWRKGGVKITGATLATLSLTNLTAANNGSYDVVVSNHIGSVTSAAAVLNVEAPPAVTAAPAARIIGTPGQELSLSVTASSASTPLTYQWKKNNTLIAGATTATFSLGNFTNAAAGAYTLEITDAHGLVSRSTTFVLPKFGATQVVGWGSNSYGPTTVPAAATGVITVSAGANYSVALKSDGTVAVWGNNDYGQTAVPTGLANVVAISAGGSHILALKADGTVTAWGQNYYNQTTVPAGLAGVIAVSAGGSHSLALKSDGTVVAWGQNYYNQTILPAGLSGVVAISAGSAHSLALKSDGTVVAWGSNSYSQTAVPVGLANVTAIAAGSDRSVALRSDGTAVSWGNNSNTGLPTGLTDLVAVSAGNSFGLASNTAGFASAWGENGQGQAIVPAGLANVLAVSAGYYHALALRDASADTAPVISAQPQGATKTVGDSVSFAVTASGPGTLTYQWRKAGVNIAGAMSPVLSLTNVLTSAAGSYDVVVSNHVGSIASAVATLAINPIPVISGQSVGRTVLNPGQPLALSVIATGTGTLTYQWSRNGVAIAGATSATYSVGSVTRADAGYYTVTITDSLGTKRSAPMFVLVAPSRTQIVAWGYNSSNQTTIPAGLSGVAALSAGGDQSLALKADGSLTGWGSGYYGSSSLPTAQGGFVAIATGSSHNLGVKSDGTVVGWGSSSVVPAALSDVVAVAAGYYKSYALKSDGTVVRWDGFGGNLLTVPANLQGVVAIAAYSNYALALKADGTVIAFGEGYSGETTVPAGLTGVVAVAAGNSTAYAAKSDGTVVAWGYGSFGQLTGAAAQANVRALAAGGNHALALRADGTVTAWGRNDYGQTAVPADLNNVWSVAAGDNHSLALRDSSADAAPTITAQPQAASRAVGSGVTFSVTATGPGPLTYQWRKNGAPFFGATGAVLTLGNLELADAGSYDVIVSNLAGGTTSAAATLIVEVPPTITSAAPARIVGAAGQPLTLTVAATSSNGPLTYQWKKNNRAIAGATTSTFSLASFTNADAGAYTLVITDARGISAFATTFVMPTYTPVQVRGWGESNYRFDTAAQSFLAGPIAVGSVSSVSIGDSFGLVLKPDGTAVGWGSSGYGQTLVPVSLVNAVSVAAGSLHSLALKADGTVLGWGYNGYGQTTAPSGLTSVIAIAANYNYSLALKADGSVVGWGQNNYGQTTPPGTAKDLSAMAAGYQHVLGLKTDGTVVAWGDNSSGQTAVPAGLNSVIAIAAGSSHSVALNADGTVIAWGNNSDGQATVPAGLSGVVAIAAGNSHTLAFKSDGTVVAWGQNYYGQTTIPSNLGTVFAIAAGGKASFALRSSAGDTAPVITAQPQGATLALGSYYYTFSVVATGSGTLTYQWRKDGVALANQTSTSCTIYSLTAGNYDVVVSNHIGSVTSAAAVLTISGPPAITLTTASRVKAATGQSLTFSPTVVGTGTLAYQWKKNNRPISGANSASFALPNFKISDAGAYTLEVTDANSQIARQTFFVLPDLLATEIRAWGGNLSGQTSVPAGLNDAVAIAAGDFHSAALRRNGTVAAWGHNAYGQSTVPTDLAQAVAVATGGYHTLALRSDGTVTAWGANSSGQTSVPTNLTGVIAIAAGSAHSVALKSDGTVLVWGASNFSQPYGAYNATGVTTIAAGSNHTLALKVDGTVIAWGSNADGQSNVPSNLTNVSAIAAGSAHSLALKSDGTVVAWGRNTEGQATVPAGLTGVVVLAANANYSWALKSDGTQIFWGDVSSGVGTPPAGTGASFAMSAGGLHALALRDASDGTTPIITAQPQAATVAFGASQNISVTAVGPGVLTYQWKKNGNNLTDGSGLAGATTSTLTLSNVRPQDSGDYSVTVSNSFGSTPSAQATLSVGQAAQSISFTAIANQRFTLNPIPLVATADSGLPVSFTVISGPASVSGSSLLIDGVGPVTVRAAQAGDATYAAAANVDRTFTVLPSFDSWRIDRFTPAELADATKSGPNAVFGADGIPNLVKYALGLEPKQNATTGLPEMSMTATDWVYTYTRPASVTDVTYSVEVSTTLTSWDTAGVVHELVSTANGIETWRARFPLASAARVFFRLQVTRP